jgi:tetratricopeptide (TPR) repeat protein
VALVFAFYFPALGAGFVWDDDKYVTENPLLTEPDGWKQIWFSAHTQSQYFPLVYSTFRLEHALWGLHPLGYHLVNVVLHGANAVLVWAVLRRLAVPAAWLGAAIFALHPVQVESVAWVTELKNLESTFFYLLAVLAWMRFVDLPVVSGQWSVVSGPVKYYFLALGAYVLALFAKTTACTLPAVLVVVLWLKSTVHPPSLGSFGGAGGPQSTRLRSEASAGQAVHSPQRLGSGAGHSSLLTGHSTWFRVLEILPFVLFGVAMGLVSIWWEGNLGTYNEETKLSFTALQRVLIASRALWFYVGKLFWPANLAFSYPQWEVNVASLGQYVPLAGCAAAAVALWVWRRRLGAGVIIGTAFFVATLLPTLGFISLYTFQYSFVADHYQYLASIGLIALFAVAVATQSKKRHWAPMLTGGARAVLILVLGCLTWRQCGAYLNAETLWRDTLWKNPESWMAHYNLGFELQTRGELDEAIEHYRLALLHNPQHAKARNNLGVSLAAQGKLAEAVQCYQAALKLRPDFAVAHNNLGAALTRQGRNSEAAAEFEATLRLDPGSLGARLNLGDCLRAQGKTREALECYRKAADLFPGDVDAWRSLGAAELACNGPEQAVAAYQRAAQLAPDRINVLMELGAAFAARTNYTEAGRVFRQALALAPDEPGAHYNLATMLALEGRRNEAQKEFEEALRLKPDFEEARRQLLLLGGGK